MTVRAFDSPEEFDEYMKGHRQRLIDAADPVEIARVLGDDEEGTYQLNYSTGMEEGNTSLIVFCRVIGKTEFMAQADEDATADYYQERWEDQKRTGMILGECFSAVWPQGEYGDTHVTRMGLTLPVETWERAKAEGWYVGDAGDLNELGAEIARLIVAEISRRDAVDERL
jgi:hypothetical protein